MSPDVPESNDENKAIEDSAILRKDSVVNEKLKVYSEINPSDELVKPLEELNLSSETKAD